MTMWLRCVEPFLDRETGDRRSPGEEWEASDDRAEALSSGPLALLIDGPDGLPVMEDDPWESLVGRELRTVPVEPSYAPVVACLNVWNDAQALAETVPTWYPYVDRVVAVDGVYRGGPTTSPGSNDGTLEFLRSLDGAPVEIVEALEGFWPDQVTKRNAYMDRLDENEVAFVVDADEFVGNAEALQDLPRGLDVGWVPYRKGIYAKDQNFPRLISGRLKARYGGRHYWLRDRKGRLVTDCQRGGPGLEHVFVPIHVDNTRGSEMRSRFRTSAKTALQSRQAAVESKVGDLPPAGRESLRIVQVAALDAGMVVFRLHSAINSTTPHTSVMCARDHGRPWDEPRQYEPSRDRETIRHALRTCDVVHCHLEYQTLDSLGVDTGDTPIVIHHHGTMLRRSPEARNRQDAKRADVRLASNPELLRYADDLHLLPNPVPARRYARLRERAYAPDPDGWFRVGHSPSKRENKGTVTFLNAMERLRRLGVKVLPVLIEGRTHADCLRIKAAECDAFFDSFWLGMQCSGIEAGAMGIPVIAGDENVRAYYRGRFGETPYVFADDQNHLEIALEALATDREYRERCAERVRDHVVTHHDYAAVTSRYLDILDDELEWIDRLSLAGSGGPFLKR